MNLTRLAAKSLARSPLRSGLTVLAATIGSLAFVFLQSVIALWYSSVEQAQADRLAVRNRTSLTQTLPFAYGRRIASVPGVRAVTYAGWFGGQKGESQRDFFPNFYVDKATYLDVYDELLVSPEERTAWRSDACGALVGADLQRRFGWEVGDRVTLNGTIYPGTWDFTIRGVYKGATRGVDTRAMVFGYRCVNERLPDADKDRVGFFGVRVDDPTRSFSVAAAIDSMFANSPNETKTESERAFRLGFVAMSGAILSAIRIVSYVVLGIMLLVVSNTIAMGVRERTVELSTLRAIGFRPRHILIVVLGEATVIGLASAALGSALAPVVVGVFGGVITAQLGSFPRASVDPWTVLAGAAAAVFVAVAAGVLPGLAAVRLPVAEGLRKVA